MPKKFIIKRKRRFFENTSLKSYTGIIFVSSFLSKQNNVKKPLGLNITNFYLYKNNFCLLDKFICDKEIKKVLIKNYALKKDEICSVDKVFLNGSKVIYLVYLDYNTKINNFTIFTTLNMFKKTDYKDPNKQDLYLAIYKRHKHLEFKKYKIFFDENNYVETTINTIFYYLIGNYEII
jgi:hypothetical protein